MRFLGSIAAGGAMLVSAAVPALAAEITIGWGDVVGGTHPQVQMIDRVAEAVAEKSGGRIEIQSYPGGQLGGSRDLIEAVATGSLQVVTEGAANFGQWVPFVSVVEAPFIWKSGDHMVNAINGALLEEINAKLEPAGMVALTALYYGTRHLTTTDTPVSTPADMEGFKIRVPQNDVFVAMARSWGAQPTPINFNELYLALQQGVVDGQENPLPTIKAGNLYEVQKNIVLTGHIITPRLVVVGADFWNGLAEEDRAIISEAVAEAAAWSDQAIKDAEATLVDEFRSQGVTVTTPDVEAFRAATMASVPEQFVEQWGEGTFERLANME